MGYRKNVNFKLSLIFYLQYPFKNHETPKRNKPQSALRYTLHVKSIKDPNANINRIMNSVRDVSKDSGSPRQQQMYEEPKNHKLIEYEAKQR